jgi:lysophospholipid acyltransferase (LPLAT)-like uncharacterized protein
MTETGPSVSNGRKRKRFQHRPAVQQILASLIASYIRLVDRTGRWRVTAPSATAALVRNGGPFIGASWHGRFMMIYPAWRRLLVELGQEQMRHAHVMTSAHGDGQLIQFASKRFGMKPLWGSSRRGGVSALIRARRVLREGDIVVMTPDGPRGPRMRAHAGVAYLAADNDVPVIPITFAARRQKTLRSWDRFMLVWPFASGVLAFGEPILPRPEEDTESFRCRIEAEMIRFALDVDRSEGLEAVEPAN